MAGPPSATSSGRRTSTGPGHAGASSSSTSGNNNNNNNSSTIPGTFGGGSALAGQDFQSIADKLKNESGKLSPTPLLERFIQADHILVCCVCTDFKIKNGLATELRDTIEMHQKDLDLGRLFEVLVPTVISSLREGKPSMIGNSGENVSSHHFHLSSRLAN
jgi:transformation/transcription domain-associated protein